LLEVTGAVRLRSDAERRRLVAGVPNGEQRGGPHSAEMTQATYHHLLALTRIVLAAEYRVIVDAAFLSREQRDMFRIWAEGRGVPFVILSLVAPDALLQQRVSRRGEDLYGAGPVVLDRQMYHQDTLTGDELSLMVTYDATRPLDDARRATTWQSLLGRLERARQSRVY
jgi:predicted kinase